MERGVRSQPPCRRCSVLFRRSSGNRPRCSPGSLCPARARDRLLQRPRHRPCPLQGQLLLDACSR
eukprot:7393544-Alexandrium_andersonii.AAC.1